MSFVGYNPTINGYVADIPHDTLWRDLMRFKWITFVSLNLYLSFRCAPDSCLCPSGEVRDVTKTFELFVTEMRLNESALG